MQVKTFKAVRTAFVCCFIFVILWQLCLSDIHPSFQLTPLGAYTSTLEVDWSRFAYTQYATSRAYLCNSVMLFETLHRLGSRADRLLMYPSDFSTDDNSRVAKLLRKARDEYGVKLVPVELQHRKGVSDKTWADSYTKLLAFNQTQYDRVLSLDSDSTLLQSLDELFLLPPSPVVLPRAYWLSPASRTMSTLIALIEPSASEFHRIQQAIANAGPTEFDMEIVNQLYQGRAGNIPHRPYYLLTGEFRATDHIAYLGDPQESWDPVEVFNQTKFLHFSDWPLPKPWFRANTSIIEANQPRCDLSPQTGYFDDCRARDIWRGIYDDFASRRQAVCNMAVKDVYIV
ncbi:nucleotide-diphospho-sugar transferase [Aspergillus uvarum CBS 121591]|uniref:Nucleotide-diphospho-sugar transferase n=1 Tax=Aspergillus uvarum CBS 121591 TaxID=1448315 RepID=A0A319C0A7_9EURO|nr:nucleotide-diphospho-sugar transferase [Aspergillus uvarum CBS 121591]PYH79446.1 nucleotide-diphospho-sugar transferase [Aspergillus uvarum CBS 121591]